MHNKGLCMKNILALLTLTSALSGATLSATYGTKLHPVSEPVVCSTMQPFVCDAHPTILTVVCKDVSEGLYVGGFGGVDFLQNIHGRDNQGNRLVNIKSKMGYHVGAAIGYKFGDAFRLEAELGYRNSQVRKINNISVQSQKIRNSTYSYMANAYFDFDVGCDFVPYIGGGAGYAQNRAALAIRKDSDLVFKDNGFCYQGIAGISVRIFDKTQAALEYRYFATKNHLKDHTVAINLKRYF